MFTVAKPFVTFYQRFTHGTSVKPEDCNDRDHFAALVASGHIVSDPAALQADNPDAQVLLDAIREKHTPPAPATTIEQAETI